MLRLCPLLEAIEALFKPEYRKKYREACRLFFKEYNDKVLIDSLTKDVESSTAHTNKKKRIEVECGNVKKKTKI